MDEPRRTNEETPTLTLGDVVRFIRRGFVLALIVGLAAAVAAYFLRAGQEPIYEAAATILVARNGGDIESFGASLVTAPTVDPTAYRVAALTQPRLRQVLTRVGVDDPTTEQIATLRERASLTVETAEESDLLHIAARDPDPVVAARIANALADELVLWDAQRATTNLNQIIASLESQIAALDRQIANLQEGDAAAPDDQLTGRIALRADRQEQLYYARTLVNSAVGLLSVIEPATVPREPVAPDPLQSAILGFIFGVMLTYAVLLIREALDTRLRDSEDVAAASGLPLLAEFPKLPRGTQRYSREAVGFLRTNLLFATENARPKVILVTSAREKEGKSSLAMSLAESFVRSHHRTLLVDANLRQPVLGKEYGLREAQDGSLRAWLQDPRREHNSYQLYLDTGNVLDLIPSFGTTPAPTELLSNGFRAALERWRDDYDVIVIDSAPVLPVADTATIAPHCTGVVLAVSTSTTDRRQLSEALAQLSRVGAETLGVVATHAKATRRLRARYGYGQPPTEVRGQENAGKRRAAR